MRQEFKAAFLLDSLGVRWTGYSWDFAGHVVSEYDLYTQLIARGYPIVVRGIEGLRQDLEECKKDA